MDSSLFISCFAEGEILSVWWVLQQPRESPATSDGAKQDPQHQDLPSGMSLPYLAFALTRFTVDFPLWPTFLSSRNGFSCLFCPLHLFLPSCHLHFHVDTSVKDRNYSHVRRFFLPGQDAATIKAAVVFPLPAVSGFCHSDIWVVDNKLRMVMEELWAVIQPMKSTTYSGPASCAVLAAFFQTGQEIRGPKFAAAWWYACIPLFWPTGLETLGTECCCVLWIFFFAFPAPVMQQLIAPS